MTDSRMDLKRRRPVWEAISELWLDTELQVFEIDHIAEVLARSVYRLDELREIYAFEVAPVVWGNSLSVAGVWTNFDADWLAQEIVKNVERRRKSFLYRFYVECGAARRMRTSVVEKVWQRILEILKSESFKSHGKRDN